ncbi:MAG: hypothetical protein KJ626_05715 [Verrucomicrobia bacterium]|nr:hypothetical protein [Verrucomicrobiota bacterium]
MKRMVLLIAGLIVAASVAYAAGSGSGSCQQSGNQIQKRDRTRLSRPADKGQTSAAKGDTTRKQLRKKDGSCQD